MKRPGPASTLVKHSLCNFWSRGDRGSIPAKDYFSDAIFSSKRENASHRCLKENPTIGRVLPISQPRNQKAVADKSTTV